MGVKGVALHRPLERCWCLIWIASIFYIWLCVPGSYQSLLHEGFAVVLLGACSLWLTMLLRPRREFCVLMAWCFTVAAFSRLAESFCWQSSVNKAWKVFACQVSHTIARNHLLPCICVVIAFYSRSDAIGEAGDQNCVYHYMNAE